MFAKDKPFRSVLYRKFIRQHNCYECGWPAYLGNIDAHHIETGGMGTKCSDHLLVPLCNIYARGCHSRADKSPDSADKYRPIAKKLWEEWNARNSR